MDIDELANRLERENIKLIETIEERDFYRNQLCKIRVIAENRLDDKEAIEKIIEILGRTVIIKECE